VLVLEDGPDCFPPDNIVVLPDRRGLGLPVDFSEALAVRCGWETIALYSNAPMVAINPTGGYTERERRTEKGFNRVHMENRL
jgi:hypothetical protein